MPSIANRYQKFINPITNIKRDIEDIETAIKAEIQLCIKTKDFLINKIFEDDLVGERYREVSKLIKEQVIKQKWLEWVLEESRGKQG